MSSTSIYSSNRLCGALLTLAICLLAACDGSDSGGGASLLPGTQVATGGGSATGTSNDTETDSVVDDGTSQGVGAQTQSTDDSSAVATNADFPFAGSFVVDEYSPSTFSPEYEGIVKIVPSPLSKTRLLNGSLPRSYLNGSITYRQPCGQRVSRIVLADASLRSTPITPCSSVIPNAGFAPTDFGQSNLSPDTTLVAVETLAFIDSVYHYSTIIFDVASQVVLSTWNGGYNATWIPDGRLLMASEEGLYVLDENLDNPTRLGDDITGPVGNPDVNAAGTAIVFEFNQQIWGMNIDGTEARVLLTDGSRLRFPTWAPDGSLTIAYLAVPSDDRYYANIFAADLEAGQAYALDLSSVLEFGSSNFLRTVNGPLSWNP